MLCHDRAEKACDDALSFEGNIIGMVGMADYRAIFTALETRLPQLVQDMQVIEMISAGQGFAKFRIKRNEVIQGQTLQYHLQHLLQYRPKWRLED